MKIFQLEVKRVLKTRMTRILLGIALVLSVVMAYFPVSFPKCVYTDESGERVEVKGMEAVQYIRQQREPLFGAVTPEKVKNALEVYQHYLGEYGVETIYELPEEVYFGEIMKNSPLIHGIREAFADPDTGYVPSLMEIDPKETEAFYGKCRERMTSLMKMEQDGHPAAQKKAEAMYEKVTFPFQYYYGVGVEAMDYQILLIFLITVFCAMIAAPVFSSDYQTGADDILRCTKHGRIRLGICKVLSACLISSISFLVCLVIWILVTNSLFGWESTKTSIQMIYSVSSLLNMNMGQLEWVNMILSLFSLLSIVSFILFVSSRMKSAVHTLALALVFCLLPIIVYAGVPGAVGDWLGCILPGGGTGVQNSLLYAMMDLKFLHLGPFSFWNTSVMIGASLVEILLFAVLAVISYCRKKS